MDGQISKKTREDKPPKGTVRSDAKVTKQKIMEMLLQGRKIKDISTELGLALQTVYKYTSDDKFKEELNQHHRDTLKALSLRSDGILERALAVFEVLLGDNTAPHQVKLNAVRLAMDLNQKLDENTHLAQDLETLKAAVEARKEIFDALN